MGYDNTWFWEEWKTIVTNINFLLMISWDKGRTARWITFSTRIWCNDNIPLGSPVEPLVYMITAVSSEVGPLWTIDAKNIQTIYTITITIIIIKKRRTWAKGSNGWSLTSQFPWHEACLDGMLVYHRVTPQYYVAATHLQLFRGRLSEKMCTWQSRKVIWDTINSLFLTL